MSGKSLSVSVNLLPLLLVAGLAVAGYALGGLLGLGAGLLILPAIYVIGLLIALAWAW